LSDVLLLEAELAQDIARQIQVRLTPKQQDLAHNRPLNPQAFQDYLQGRHCYSGRNLPYRSKHFLVAIPRDQRPENIVDGFKTCWRARAKD
jgi:hypothetical protein